MKSREDIIKFCYTLADVYHDYPFDENWTCIRCKDNKKAFVFAYQRENNIWINIKVSPDWAEFWRNAYEYVIPAYHMNKKHWNSVILNGTIPEEDIQRMILESYDLVKAKPRARKKLSS